MIWKVQASLTYESLRSFVSLTPRREKGDKGLSLRDKAAVVIAETLLHRVTTVDDGEGVGEFGSDCDTHRSW